MTLILTYIIKVMILNDFEKVLIIGRLKFLDNLIEAYIS